MFLEFYSGILTNTWNGGRGRIKNICREKIFQLKYLKQHFDVIKMYLTRVKTIPAARPRFDYERKKHELSRDGFSCDMSMLDVEILALIAVGKG